MLKDDMKLIGRVEDAKDRVRWKADVVTANVKSRK